MTGARIFATLFVLQVLALLQTTLPLALGFSVARADLLLVAVLFLAFNAPTVEGAALSLAAGYLQDLHAATPDGTYALLAVVMFVATRLVGAYLHAEGGLLAVAVALVATLVHTVMAAALVRFVAKQGDDGALLRALSAAMPCAVLTGLAAPLVFRVLRWIESRWAAEPEGLL